MTPPQVRTTLDPAALDRTVLTVTAGRLPTLDRVGTDRLVTIDGQTGVFTPVTGADVGTSSDNLEKVVDALRGELASAQAANAELEAKLAALADPPRSSDDVADGLQHALDGLSERLGAMANETSNFAVREFTLESKVHVDVTPLGTMGFQFVRPGEQVNAAALSTMTMTVVPVPKPPPEEAVAPAAAVVDRPVEEIDGLTDAQVAALRGAHVTTTSGFARLATRATASATLVSLLGVDRETLGRFTLLAGLLAVPGLDGTSAAVLHDAGIPDAATLAGTDPADARRALPGGREAAPGPRQHPEPRRGHPVGGGRRRAHGRCPDLTTGAGAPPLTTGVSPRRGPRRCGPPSR